MCDSCVPSASKPMRLSTNGCDRGRVSLLIDSDEHGTVISVEVNIDELIAELRRRAMDYMTAWDDWIIPEARPTGPRRGGAVVGRGDAGSTPLQEPKA